ncbi:MAG: hypothetical protein AVDCRST_MAG88-2430, partial [uncultured Thermomicrobiales bacterium]
LPRPRSPGGLRRRGPPAGHGRLDPAPRGSRPRRSGSGPAADHGRRSRRGAGAGRLGARTGAARGAPRLRRRPASLVGRADGCAIGATGRV